MKDLLIKAAKVLLYSWLVFYVMVATCLILLPDQRNLFTLLSCFSAIVTIGLCGIASIVKFDKKNIKSSLINTLTLFFVCGNYIAYLKTEYAFLSTSFHIISILFDIGTALLSFLVVKGITHKGQ